ncbi:DUF305 domain-containing protein [Nonomuraea sp. NPDC003804]|uniref:DUF305 domain-containing protein n=1 Tax=Nonomuraea sp. NPDC003804 TaxID=3154547 RepID=UPI0033BCC17F
MMSTDRSGARRLRLAVGAATLLLVAACGTATAGPEGPGAAPGAVATTATAQPGAAFDEADVMFAQMMIPHHQQAVEMAELAETRAADPEVKELAARIKAAQEPEIQSMRSWLGAWGRLMPSDGMHHDMPGIMSADDMKRLEAAEGAAFDKLFGQLMIAHHKGAIEMAEAEQARGVNPEAKELARTIASTQQAEVDQLRQILDRL